MDKYGFGGYVRNLVKQAQFNMCQTGRTTSMLDRVKPTDLVVFVRHEDAAFFKRKAASAGKEFNFIVCPPKELHLLSDYARGRTVVLDHRWVEEYFELVVEQAMQSISDIEKIRQPEPQNFTPEIARGAYRERD